MAVTRHCYQIYAGANSRDNMMQELEHKLNAALGSSERIVHMQQSKMSSDTWYVVTEELIMGPSKP